MAEFSALGLSARTLRALNALDFYEATPIQTAAIPSLLEGRDLIGVAQTGSGKTAAFVLPLIEAIAAKDTAAKPTMPRALILAPTRELAQQISVAVRELSTGQRVSHCVIFGGSPFKTQSHILKRGVDIVIATPGRLMDHIKRGNIYLDETEYFVLDEADRMLDMGFIEDVRFIARKLPDIRQSVMFSATFDDAIRVLSSDLLIEPEYVEMARQATIADNLKHTILYTPKDKKRELLLFLIQRDDAKRALVFTRTKGQADDLAEYLIELGYSAKAIHGDKPQRMRERTLKAFKADRVSFLVATDVAARGIDVPDITHVFNTDVPLDAENYVHRIGRTARGNKSGRAYTLCDQSEFRLVRAIEKVIKQAIETETDHPFPLNKIKKKPISRKKSKQSATPPKRKPGKKVTEGKRKALAKQARKRANAKTEHETKASRSDKGKPSKSTAKRTAKNSPRSTKKRGNATGVPKSKTASKSKSIARGKPGNKTGGNKPLSRRK